MKFTINKQIAITVIVALIWFITIIYYSISNLNYSINIFKNSAERLLPLVNDTLDLQYENMRLSNRINEMTNRLDSRAKGHANFQEMTELMIKKLNNLKKYSNDPIVR